MKSSTLRAAAAELGVNRRAANGKGALKMLTQHHGLLFSLLALMAAPAMIADKARADPPSPPPWEQLLWWLPEDTETIVVAQGPVELAKPAADEPKFRD